MQAITPVNIRVENDWRNGINIKNNLKTSTRKDRQTSRIRTKIVNKPKIKKKEVSLSPKSRIPKQVVNAKIISPVQSRSSSPNRGPWVPPPGRSTKGHNYSWQSPRARLEIIPTTEILIEDRNSLNSERDKHNTSLISQTNTFSTVENEKLMNDIQIYENRIQGLIEGIGMLKERIHNHDNQEQTDQLRSDIDSSLFELERLQNNYTQQIPGRTTKFSRSKSLSPIRNNNINNNRSISLDQQRQRRPTTPRVSFQDEPIIEKRRQARSTTPIKGPIRINPDREQLLISLAQSESDIAQITKHICSVKDILIRLKFDDQPVSFEIEQLYQHRNELLHLIEQFERSNKKLVEYLRHQYHLEAEHGIMFDKYDTLTIELHELKYENEHMRHLLLERENDNIALQTEIERIRTQTINFDTMKTSLEHNRAHLQRELYAREGEINRLQCALRALERDLQHSRYHYGHTPRSTKSSSKIIPRSSSSSIHIGSKTKALTIERLQDELNDRNHQINDLKNQLSTDKDSEILFLRTKLQQAEHIANEYKAQLHTQTLKTSANNSRNHLSEIELEKIRTRLQKRIEDLEPLPTLLKQEELKNEKLQKQINDLQKRSSEQSNFHTQPFSPNDDNNNRTFQQRLNSLEEENDKLLKTLHAKEEEIRILQSRLNSKTYDITSIHKHNDLKQIDTINSKQPFIQTNTFDLEQQLTRLRLEYKQLKREKDEVERRFTSQMNELREKFEHSNNTNRALQNYINSFKTTYATLFNDALPTSLTRYTTT